MGVYKDPKYKAKHAILPRSRYVQQKAHAKERGIAFTIYFEDWWSLWVVSGQWHNRGKKPGQYCMTRIGDVGGYELGNVEIKQVSTNLIEQIDNGHHVSAKLEKSGLSQVVLLSEGTPQAKIGKMLGLSQSHVSRLINGKRGVIL